MSLRQLTPDVWVAGQIGPVEIEQARALGVKRVINNRPDGEDPAQPGSAEVEAWVRQAGLDYVWAPVRGRPGPDEVARMAQALEDGAPVLAYCRSGMRSAAAWAMAQAGSGTLTPDQVRFAAFGAGYDLSGLPLGEP